MLISLNKVTEVHKMSTESNIPFSFPGTQATKEGIFKFLTDKGQLAVSWDEFNADPVGHLGGTVEGAIEHLTIFLKHERSLTMNDTATAEPKAKPAKEKKERKPSVKPTSSRVSLSSESVLTPTGNIEGVRSGITPTIVGFFDGSKPLDQVLKAAKKELAGSVKSGKFTDDPDGYIMKHVRRAIGGGALTAPSAE